MQPMRAQAANRPTVVRVQNLPHFVDQQELTRVFQPSPGLLHARLLGGGVAHVSFVDPSTALNCKSLYHNWQGWGPALVCDILPDGAGGGAVAPGGAKRPREDEGLVSSANAAAAFPLGGGAGAAYSPYDPAEQYSKRTALPGGPGAPALAFAGAPAMSSNLQPAQAAATQQVPMSRAAANPLSSVTPPDLVAQPAMQGLAPASAQQQQQQPASSAGLAAALANLNPAQLNSLAGLLNQAVASSGAPLATSLPLQQPAVQHALSGPAPIASQPLGLQAIGNQQYSLQQQPAGAAVSAAPAGQLYTTPMQVAPQQPQLQQQAPQLAQFQQLLGGQLPQQQPQQQPPAAVYSAVPQQQQQQQQQPAYTVQQPQQQPLILGMQGSAPMIGQPLQLAQQPPPQQQQPLLTSAAPQDNYAVPPHLVGGSTEPAGAVRGAPQAQERYPPNASSTLYLDGIPQDMTAREAEHIFRPVQGFQDLRLISKENPNKPGERSLKIFVDFADIPSAAAAINLLQGYRIDRKDEDSPVLRPVFGRPQYRGDRRAGPPDHRPGGPREPYNRNGPPPPRRGEGFTNGSRAADAPGSYRRPAGGERERGGERTGPPPERDTRGGGDERRRSRW